MVIQDKIKQLSRLLETLGKKGSSYRIAKLLGVSQSTVTRWLNEQTTKIKSPHIEHAILTLENVLQKAVRGSKAAHEVLFGSFSKEAGILDSIRTAMEVLGAEWLFSNSEKKADRDRPAGKDARHK